MKKIRLMLISICFPCLLYSQINKEHNRIRQGDKLVKYQVEYKDPGKAGENIVWDFSSLKTINDEYTVNYSLPYLLADTTFVMGYNIFPKAKINSENLIVRTEHNTMYYYQIRGDSLLLLGHENPAVKLQYIEPYVQLTYPFHYGQQIESSYRTKGLYSGTDPIKTEGVIRTVADAYGKMILPTGDTLNPVLRIRTIQTIKDKLQGEPEKTIKEMETCR